MKTTISILVASVVFFGIALGLASCDKPEEKAPAQNSHIN